MVLDDGRLDLSESQDKNRRQQRDDFEYGVLR